MPSRESIFAATIAIVSLGVAIIFGWRQFRQLRRGPNPDSADYRFVTRTARRRLIISGMLGLIGLLIGAYYLTGLDQAVVELKPIALDKPPDENQRRILQLSIYCWIGILILLFGIVIAVGIDLWDVRRHWRQSLQRIRD